jgi:hypothetical protein
MLIGDYSIFLEKLFQLICKGKWRPPRVILLKMDDIGLIGC